MASRVHRVRVAREALAAILSGHAAASDREPCGVLVGSTGPHRVDVLGMAPARNAHPTPSRAFLVEPEDALGVERKARAAGLDVVGTWHGHLAGDAALSPFDARGLVEGSTIPGREGTPATRPHVFLVSSRGTRGRVSVAAWTLDERRGPVEVPLGALPLEP